VTLVSALPALAIAAGERPVSEHVPQVNDL
jgi:hypothetical protein